MQGEPLTSEFVTVNGGDRKNIREEVRAMLEVLLHVGIAFFIVIVVAGSLRATEIFLEAKIILSAEAATRAPANYETKLIVRSESMLRLAPEEAFIYRVGFKNLGTQTWKPAGPGFVSIYTMDPKYRKSVFYDTSWYKPEQPALLRDPNVPSGTVGYVEFILRAPREMGSYIETFQLAVEDRAWIDGGKFTVQIEVRPRGLTSNAPEVQPPYGGATSGAVEGAAAGYSATLLLRSHKGEIALGPGATVDLTLGFKNTGTQIWQSRALRYSSIAIADAGASVRHLSWVSSDQAARVTDVVKPGEIGFVRFTLQAPNRKGSYSPRFQLQADGATVSGGEIEIPITVTADGSDSAVSVPMPAFVMISEPKFRVGLFHTLKAVSLAASGDYTILEGTNAVERVPGGQPAQILYDFDYKTFSVTTPAGTRVLRGPVRFEPTTADGIFTITSYVHPPGWNQSLNDNRFRGILEIAQAPESGRLWVIEELPIEQYLYGIAETSNNTHTEFQKALATATRTYAFYHFSRNSKHGGVFHVDAHYDQVYRGYASEQRMPNLVSAVNASRGVIATYNNEVAITPYYSRSDGRTRAWEEVWGGGPIPWLKSVPAPYDAGRTLWGHGVGMSARDALLRAEAGSDWQTISKYYYTGIDLQKKWN